MPPILRLALLGLSIALGPGAQAPEPATAVYTDTVTIPTYPYGNYVHMVHSPTYNMDYAWLDWSAYQASNPQPWAQQYTLVVMDNPWLRLSVMPQLGGRLYGVTVKATGEQLLYQNPVIKPTHWGPPEQGWWLAAGGIEWCLPVEEHGYEWGIPWAYTDSVTPEGSVVTVWDSSANDRIRARIRIELPADQAAFRVIPRMENPTGAPITFKFWDNAMLAPGAPNTVGPELRFLVPIPQVTVHSRGDWWLPDAGQPMEWPVYGGTDYSRLGNWNRWLGFFARPQAAQDWAGVYDQGTQRGVARVFPRQVAEGVKGFGMGWANAIHWSAWSDAPDTYVELHGGPAPTFWDSITLQPGAALEWTETWLPLRNLPLISLVTPDLALGLEASGADLDLGFVLAGQHSNVHARLWRQQGCELVWQVEGLALAPGQAYTHHLAGVGLSPEEVVLGIFEGSSLLYATGDLVCPPPASQVLPLDLVQTDPTFVVSWSGQDAGRGLASYDVQVRDGDTNAPWAGWLAGTADTSATFAGLDGHTYTFRSRVRDPFGSEEAWPIGAWQDASTTVLLQPAPVLIRSEKVVSPRAVPPGGVAAFEIRLRNTGNLSASVELSDPLPPDLTLTAGPWISPASAPAPVMVGNTLVWSGTVPSAPGGVQFAIGFEAQADVIPPASVLTNTAWIDVEAQSQLVRRARLQVGYLVHLPLVMRAGAP